MAFNKNLTNDDGLLTGAVMSSENLSYKDAKNEVLKFSNGLAYQLKKEEQITLDGLGKFHIINQQIKFQPFSTKIANKASFGLPDIEVNPISRDLLKEKKQKLSERNLGNVQKKIANKRQQSLKLHFSLAFVVLMIGLLSSLIFSNHKAVNKFHQNASFVEMFFNSDTPQLNLTRNIATKSIESVFQQRENDELGAAQYLNISNNSSPKGFLIIVGSYASESNAKRMENKLFNEGYDTYILPTDNGFFRVGIFASDNFARCSWLNGFPFRAWLTNWSALAP
jgi:hypothetical protein